MPTATVARRQASHSVIPQRAIPNLAFFMSFGLACRQKDKKRERERKKERKKRKEKKKGIGGGGEEEEEEEDAFFEFLKRKKR